MSESTTQSVLFPELISKPVLAAFDQAHSSSDGGGLLLKAIDERLKLSEKLADCLRDGAAAGRDSARAAGFDPGPPPVLPRVSGEGPVMSDIRPLWAVPLAGRDRGKRFVDLQNDVTAEDLALAVSEGYRSVEHVKRYTTTGMGTDQGKTSNVNAIGIIAQLTGCEIPEVGVTTFRPPYTPVTFGTIVGRRVGRRLAPTRRSPFHQCSEEAGAVFVPLSGRCLVRRPGSVSPHRRRPMLNR